MALVIRNSSGWATHRIERAAKGVDLVVINKSTGFVEERIEGGALAKSSFNVGNQKVCWVF